MRLIAQAYSFDVLNISSSYVQGQTHCNTCTEEHVSKRLQKLWRIILGKALGRPTWGCAIYYVASFPSGEYGVRSAPLPHPMDTNRPHRNMTPETPATQKPELLHDQTDRQYLTSRERPTKKILTSDSVEAMCQYIMNTLNESAAHFTKEILTDTCHIFPIMLSSGALGTGRQCESKGARPSAPSQSHQGPISSFTATAS